MPRRVKNPRVPRTRAGGKWTESEYWSFLRGVLRQAVRRYPVKHAVKQQARRVVKGKRWKYEYKCAACEGWFKDSRVEVDHITPAGSLKSYEDLPRFVATLYCEADNLQVLCKECHRDKTNREKEERKKNA